LNTKLVYFTVLLRISDALDEQCPAHWAASANQNPDMHYLFVGNPGVGKSTLLNGLAGKAVFHAGVSYGKGMTQVLSVRKTCGGTLVDTPGLADAETFKMAAKEIETALKLEKTYKVAFVVTIEAGRVRPDDLYTMQQVLKAASQIKDYGIVLNKLPKVVYGRMTAEPMTPEFFKVRGVIIAALKGANVPSTDKYLALPYNEDLESVDDELPCPNITAALSNFLNELEGNQISKDKVGEVKYIQEEMNTLKTKYQEELDNLKKQETENRKRSERMQDDLREARKKADEANAKMAEVLQDSQWHNCIKEWWNGNTCHPIEWYQDCADGVRVDWARGGCGGRMKCRKEWMCMGRGCCERMGGTQSS